MQLQHGEPVCYSFAMSCLVGLPATEDANYIQIGTRKLTSKTSMLNPQRARQIKSRLVSVFGRVQKVVGKIWS
ncbi:hypothetical protein MKW98_006245 [Papaver atlanticum]|uniref:Uncharacterized protein n=1 Tax=Papaver atlanticum TaxID=357466 RepID=A0AAD4TH18_9MAGN|nr:hypothetical protein MKW98_006245 [Papaver atlanticum]